MNPLVQVEGLEKISLPARPLHLAIGVFDGVHRGHRLVIEAAVQAARRTDGIGGVLTFWPHPSAVFRPDHRTRLMLDAGSKARVLQSLGVEVVITQPFNVEFSRMPAPDFASWLRQRLPRLAALYVGDDFRFGHGREGDVNLLSREARALGMEVVVVPRLAMEGGTVSSSRIRAGLSAGDIELVNRLLGYPYFARGVVTPGKQLGRTIGFPTLNLPWGSEFSPRLGVYAVRVSGEKSSANLSAVANFGLRPTVENAKEPRLEVHVLGDCPFGPGDTVTVAWQHFLRPEAKFSDVAKLRAQIAKDREAAVAYFRSPGPDSPGQDSGGLYGGNP